MATKKIIMLVGDFVEDYEAMVPYQILTMVGHEVATICPNKKKGEFVKTAIHDFEGDQTYTEKRGHNFILNTTFDEINPEDYDALVIPGGRAPEYLRLNEKAIKMVQHFEKEQKPIAAVCHGPQLLVSANILKDKTCSAYPAVKPDIIMAGGIWSESNESFTSAITCNNLVTAPARPAHPEWMSQFLKLLGSKIEA